MGGVIIPFVPAGVWLAATSTILVILLTIFCFYLYHKNRIKALGIDAGDLAAIASEKQLLQSDVESLRQWIRDHGAELQRLTAEREEQERVRAELQHLEQSAAEGAQKNESLRKEVGELESQRYFLQKDQERLAQVIGDLEGKRQEANDLAQQLDDLRGQAEKTKAILQQAAEQEAHLRALATENATLEQHLQELNDIIEKNRPAAEEVQELEASLENRRREQANLNIALDALRGDQKSLEQNVAQLKKQDDEARNALEALQQQVRGTRQEADQTTGQLAQAKAELAKTQTGLRERQEAIDALQTRKAVLDRELEHLEGRTNGTRTPPNSLAPYADLLDEPKGFTQKSFPDGECQTRDEMDALRKLMGTLTENGLSFSERMVNAFHTSLKCHDINPLTVLAGVSGTGKTLLPVCYARVMGMHSLVMSVQPRWDSPQDMFGFYNYMEKQYKATDLSRILLRMDPYNYQQDKFPMLGKPWAQNRMLLVLLDEMNLARTEYYFSDFLSKLELRCLVQEVHNPQDRKNAEIELDAGPTKDVRFRIWVGQNVLFVGTMNEDETTQTLSDKVLDRSNVLRFGKPSDTTMRQNRDDKLKIPLSSCFLSWQQWKFWLHHFDTGLAWSDDVQEIVASLNKSMDTVGRPFGYRLRNAFLDYVANYPLVNEQHRYKLAVADQIEQKILPKLRGIDCNEDNAQRCLDALAKILEDLDDNELAAAFKTARDESKNFGMFQWRGVVRSAQNVG